ncbi:MAG: carboxypeptidase regulatory-like domain-containing protein [Janthinobacterium lividum]
MRRFAAALLALFFSFLSYGFAQTATTSLRGVVQDSTGAVIPGATIVLVNKSAGQKLTETSNHEGEYQLIQITPATYNITVTAPGFGSATKSAELLVNQPATINFTLGLQNTETVNVTEAAQTLNQTDATLGNSYDNATIQAIPTETRNIPDLLSLQPGVFYFPAPQNVALQDSRSGAVNGERSDQSNLTLDGVDDNDQLRGLAFFGVLRETQDSAQEFRVVTSNANADEGRSAGAQVSLVTKSGTNTFHGAAYEYNRPTNTVSNDYFNKQGQLESGEANRPPKLIRNIFGGDVGGFIIKDKLFFFGNYEGSRLAESQVVVRTTPTASYKQGILQYTSGGSPVALSPTQVAALDAGCTVCGTAAYPSGPGPNPNSLAYFNSEPTANGATEGDGLNEGSYTFSSPAPQTLNTSIIRLDYTPTSAHHFFARGGLQKDTLANAEQFPGQPASSILVDNSKGMIFGDTWAISPRLVNDLRYGYIRQGYGSSGVGSGDYVNFRFIDTATAQTRNTVVSVPVNNIVDNFTISKGKHTIGLGGNWRLIHINRASDSTTFNSASTNPYWLGGNPPDPAALGNNQPTYDGGFKNSYEVAYANLVGTVPEVTNTYNYAVTSPTAGSLLPDGAYLNRHFKVNEFEYYLQDQWQVRPNLTVTYGIRHTILQTPYETSGQQVAPTIDTHAWFMARESAALTGQVYEPDLQFAPTGPHYGKPGFWPKSKDNIAPRLSIAYAPDTKTSIRAGFGIYYDHYGEGLINTFDQNGSFGLATNVTNPAGQTSYENSPRFTGRNTLPFSNGSASASTSFPYTAPVGNFAITWGLDNRLKTPYTEAMDFSVQHEFARGFTLETAYVGRLGRHLLQNLDLAEPVDYTDPQGGGDYYTAGGQLSAAVDANGGNQLATVAPIPYFEHVFSFMANNPNVAVYDSKGNQIYSGAGHSATQNAYTAEWAPYRYNLGATTSLADIDFFCAYGCPGGYQSKFWQDQFSSLYALSTIGMSYYNALQVSLRHPVSHGLQFDFNYTFSKSIDMGSDAERTSEFSNGVAYASSNILNTWKPYLNRAVSDFDTRHIITTNAEYALPVGRGKALLGSTNHLVDAFVGGWQLSGVFRATSGLPFSVTEPGWSTDWQIESYAVVTGKVKAHKHFDASGDPLYFDSATNINNGIYTGSPMRLPYPGEAGERNFFRGDGYLDLDSSVTKSWKIEQYGAVKFDWAVYNVTNTNRFDPQSINGQLTSATLGTASALLGTYRRMQFALRYDF